LAATLIADNIARDGRPVNEKFLAYIFIGQHNDQNRCNQTHLGVAYRRFKQFFEVLIPFLILIASFPPLSHSLAVKDKNVEESVQEEYDIRLDRYAIKKDRNWRDIECVRHQSGLYHCQ
jgi:hypothetical protein